MADARVSMNPRREVSPSFDIESEDVLDAWLAEGANAEAGDRMARAVHAADRKEVGAMVMLFCVKMWL